MTHRQAPGVRDDELERLKTGGQAALADLFGQCRSRLERMVRFRLDPRLRMRVDADDILQDAYIEIARRLEVYLAAPRVSFYVWARQITWQKLIDCHRIQLGQKRNPYLEVHPPPAGGGNTTSVSIARALVGEFTSPSGVAMRKERAEQLHDALDGMDPTDQEVLALRHFEQLGNKEVAEVLGLSPAAASRRYMRALQRLAQVLGALPQFKDRL